jgi:hypothetical protein
MLFVGLLNAYVSCIKYVVSNEKRQAPYEWRVEKDVGGSGRGLREDILSVFATTELTF